MTAPRGRGRPSKRPLTGEAEVLSLLRATGVSVTVRSSRSLLAAVAESAAHDLRLSHGRLLARRADVDALLAGGAGRRRYAVGSAVDRLFTEYTSARRYFVAGNPASTFAQTAAFLGLDAAAVRERLAPWLALPWNGLVLRRRLGAEAAYRKQHPRHRREKETT